MRTSLSLALTVAALAGTLPVVHALAQGRPSPQDRFNNMGRGRITPPTTPPAAPPAAASTAAMPDQGVHNAVHAAHQNQIVFTRTDSSIGGISEADIVSDFTLGQPMFFRVFTERSAVNAIGAANGIAPRDVYADGVHYLARFTIAGRSFETSMFPWGQRNHHQTWTTWRGQFVNPTGTFSVPGSDVWLEMLSRATSAGLLTPGRHSVRMELIARTNTERNGPISAGTVASGTFNLTVPAGVFRPGNPHVCGPVRGAAGSPAIETRALAQARQFWDKPNLTPVRAIASGNDWDVVRHEITGIPIERTTRVTIFTRGTEYCTSQTHRFTERHMGGGSYSTATGTISVNWDPGYVPCACLG